MSRTWLGIVGCFSLIFSVHAEAAQYNVEKYGAAGIKSQNAQSFIQTAIDECHDDGGGTVYFPTGDYFSGEIRLRSNVSLHLLPGATLWASTKKEDYPEGSRGRLLVANGVENIAIEGQGTIHGQAPEDYGSRWGVPDAPEFRTGILLFENCRDVSIRDVKIMYSDSWTVHLKRCEDVVIDGVTIFNNVHRLNSDGIDPNSCRNVRISNCHIVAGDDCIVFKATEPYPCEDIVVTNCTLETTTTGIKLGTESRGDFRNIRVSNCVIKNTRTGIGFFMKDGTTMERVSFSNISIENLKSDDENLADDERHDVFPIFMDVEKRHEDTPIGKIRDVSFQDIDIVSGSGILIQGMPESPIENLTLRNITLRADWLDDYSERKKAIGGRRTYRDDRDHKFAQIAAYTTIAHAKDVVVDDLRVYIDEEVYDQEERSAFYGYHISQLSLNGLYGDSHHSINRTPIVILDGCRHGVLSGCVAPRVNTAFLRLKGERTRRILIVGNDFSNTDMLVNADDDLLSGEYKVIGNYELRSRHEGR